MAWSQRDRVSLSDDRICRWPYPVRPIIRSERASRGGCLPNSHAAIDKRLTIEKHIGSHMPARLWPGPSQWRAALLAGVRLTAFFTARFAAFLAGVRLTAFFTVRVTAFLAGCVLLAVFVELRLAAPAFAVPVLALAGLPRRFEPDLALPTTLREPIWGANVDSSPADHFTCKRAPITPVTTPSRGAWPTFVDATCTRSPMSAICTSLVAGIRSPMLSPWESERASQPAAEAGRRVGQTTGS